MAVKITFLDRADFQFEIPLDRTVYLMRLRWNHYSQSWAMDLLTRARTALVYGTRLVPGVPLLAEHAMEFRPPGEFYVFGTPLAFDSFTRGDATLLYLTEEEMEYLQSLSQEELSALQ